ncbi:hypothetical protein [Hymenobacter aerophilus]|uniref:hypothetical protein n=1 Tax=Hymenobacter aerophilus TaxID=119644 RepID=UPI0003A055DA|nr:hypothetical protein [Hymenobacter aerophilus]
MKPTLRLGLAAIALLGACTKEDAPPDDRSLLIGKDWMRSGGTITSNGTVKDVYADLSPCDQDDFLRFEEADRLLYDEGPSRCNPATPQTLEGTWFLAEEDRLLNLDIGSGLRGERQITELTESRLSLSYTSAGKLYTLSFTRR